MMSRLVRFLPFLALFALAACITPPAGSTGAAPSGDAAKNIAIVTPYMANATTKYVIDRFQELGAAKGWNVSVSDSNSDFNLLVSQIETAVTQKSDAIILGMGDPAQMTKGLDAAKAANIPVFGLDAGVADGVAVNITSDNGQLGQISAHALAEAIGGKGSVILFTHDPHPGVRARAEAAAAEFAKYPDIKVIEKKHIDVPGPLDFARSLMQDLLTSYPNDGDIAGVWAGWDEPAMGATQAIDAAGRKGIQVVGIDGTDFAKAEILKGGPFIATVAQDFDGMAQQLVDIVEAQLAGTNPESNLVTIGGVLITKENAK